MARPCKKRWICGVPRCRRFLPLSEETVGQKAGKTEGICAEECDIESVQSERAQAENRVCPKKQGCPRRKVQLSLDEYECIRLIDYEGLEQEQCAAQMGVARTTVQAIYKSAREKLADFLVNAKELCISGGEVVMKIPKGGQITMRIAVTYENGQIFQHFGHTEQFKLYDIEDGKIASTVIVDTNGNGHGALAGFLLGNQADVLICGGIGGGAQAALSNAGIKLYGGVSGDADAAVEAFLKKELAYNPNVQCNHHGEGHHHEGGSCGTHGCGGGHCGGTEV